MDAGIIPSKEERAQATMQQVTPAVPALTQFQRTILGSAAIMEETCRVFGEPLPDVKEMEHNLRISREIDKMTGGKALQLSLNGPAEEWNRLKVLAEERLKKPS